MIIYACLITFLLALTVNISDGLAQMKLELAEELKKLKTALVIPCTLKDLIMNAPFLFDSIANGTPPPEETIMVFGLKNPLITEIEKIFPKRKSRELDTLRLGLLSFFMYFDRDGNLNEDDIGSEWLELTNDETLSRSLQSASYLTGLLRSVNLKRLIGDDFTLLIENNLELLKGMESLITLGERIPNFKILLNYTETPWANSNREFGTTAAFGPVPQDNEVVSYIDCDDEMTPHRVHMIEQSLKENPEVTGIIHGWIPRDYRDSVRFYHLIWSADCLSL